MKARTIWIACGVFAALWLVCPSAATAQAKDDTKEQSIYIPYKKLRDVFEKEGRVVFMPYDKFLELWKDRYDRTPGAEVGKPPVDWIISEVTNAATVSKDVVTVTATVKIEVLKEGWNEVSLGLRDAAVTKATLDGAPARILFAPGVGYKLLVEKKGAAAQTMSLSLEFAKTFNKAPGQNSVSFETPRAPVSKWEVRIPEPGVKVNVADALASTEAPAGPKAEETVVMAFVGAAPIVRIDWTPKAEGAKGLTALASVSVEQSVDVDEGVVRTRAKAVYSISRAELTQLLAEVPADQKVVNVFDPNVREWKVDPLAGGAQQITVQLFEPAKTTQNLVIELQRFVAEAAGAQEISAPVVKFLGVSRQQGVVVVRVADTLRSEATKRTGLMQVDASEIPAGLGGARWQYMYRYAALPYDLALSVEKVRPEIEVDTLIEAHLSPEEMKLDVLAVFDIQRAGVFRLDLAVPEGYGVLSVAGAGLTGVTPVQVDTHHVEGAAKTQLVVNLTRKAIGKVGLAVVLRKRLAEPELLNPTGKSATVPVGIVRAAGAGLKRQTTRVVVYAPESLRVNPTDVKGLRPVSAAEATANMRATQAASERPVVAYMGGDEAVTLTLAGERRKPQVTARQFLVVRVEPGVVTYEDTFFYNVLYSGVKSLRLDVPSALASDIRISTPGVRYEALEGADKPQDLAEGYVAWKLMGETEFLGEVKVVLNKWEKKIEKLDAGKSVPLAIPWLKPMGVDLDRAWGQIVLVKAETIDVRADNVTESLRPIDPQHDLMPGASVAGSAARAFEFHEAWNLVVTATQLRLQEVKRTSIERAMVRMVVTRADTVSVQAVYRIRSQEQRLHLRIPGVLAGANPFDTEPLRINGRAVTLEQVDPKAGIYAVPLLGQAPEQAFLLELRCRVPLSSWRFECPSFVAPAGDNDTLGEPAVQTVYLGVYLPEEYAYLGSTGPWTDEIRWDRDMVSSTPVATGNPADILGAMKQGIGGDLSRLDAFPVEGHLYLFSTLGPVPTSEGALSIVALRESILNIIILVVVLVVGAALLRACWVSKALATGSFITVIVLMGVFLPTLLHQVWGSTLVAGAFIVAIAWVIQGAMTFAGRRPKRSAPTSPPTLAPAAAEEKGEREKPADEKEDERNA